MLRKGYSQEEKNKKIFIPCSGVGLAMMFGRAESKVQTLKSKL